MSHLAKRTDKSLSEALGDASGVKKALHKSTAPLKLQQRRTEIEGCRIRVENLLSRFKNRSLTPKQRQEIYLECQLMASFGMLKGITLLTDMLSYQDKCKIRNNKTGAKKSGIRRVAYMEYVWDRLTEIRETLGITFSANDRAQLGEDGDDVPETYSLIQAVITLDQKITHMYDMLHEIGLHHNPQMFELKDSNNVTLTKDRFTDPPDFFDGKGEGSEEEMEEVGEDDEEVLSEEDAEAIRKKAETEEDEEDDLPEEEDEEEEDEEDEER